MEEEDVVIVGAGIAGLATAVALKRVGVRALVLEKSEGLRATGTALGLSKNAWLALDALGIAHKLTATYAHCIKGSITNVDTGAIQKFSFAKSEGGGHVFRVIHRKALLEALAEELPVDSIRFSSKLKPIGNQAQNGSSLAIIHLADGASIKAKWLGLTAPVNSGRWSVRGLALFPEDHRLNLEFQQFVTNGKRAGFFLSMIRSSTGLSPTNSPPKVVGFVCIYHYLPTDTSLLRKAVEIFEDLAQNPELLKREVSDKIAKDFPPVYLRIVQHSDLSKLTWAPLVFRFPWDIIFGNLSKWKVSVAGNAMHPMTPDLAQGGCAVLEDAVVLGRHFRDLITRSKGILAGDQVAGALKRYSKETRWRAAHLITSSFLSGWVQQDGSGWLMKLFRDVIYYRLLYTPVLDAVHYDCEKLSCLIKHYIGE